MAQTTKVKGVIGSTRQWPSGKGYFLTLEDDSNDYYGFGSCKYSEGDEVEIDVQEGTGKFSDKFQVVAKQVLPATPAQAKPKAPEAKPAPVSEYKNAANVYFERQDIIVKQTCLKAAAELVGELQGRTEKQDWNWIAKLVNKMADLFYEHITGQDNDKSLDEAADELPDKEE